MSLPEGIPTVTVTGRFLTPDGQPMSGQIVFRAPSLLTFADEDVFVGGPVTVALGEATGAFKVTLPATDAPGMVPSGWSYTVTEQFTGVPSNRTYQILLPAAYPAVDLADLAPTDPTTPTYVAVRGDSAYEVAVDNGFAGTEAEWLASLVGPQGAPGGVQSVAGVAPDTVGDVPLTAPDVGAAPAGHTHTPAELGAAPTDHTHTAPEVGAIPTTEKGTPSGVATLDAAGKIPAGQLPEGTGSGGSTGALNVRDYGATGNGTTDDAPAIQAALTDAATAGGWVILPPGDYRCATLPLRAYGDLRLTLAGGARFVRGGNGTFLINGDSAQSFGGYTGHGNLLIEGGVWDMRGADPANSTNPDMCISIGHAQNVTIRDLEIRDVAGYHAVELNSTKHALISNCQFRGYVDTGGRDFSEAVQFDGAFRSTVFGAFGPYDGTTCEEITMRDCYVGPSGTPGTVAWPGGVGSHSAAAGQWHRRIRIESNTFEGGAQYAVKPYIWDGSVISGNTIDGYGAGVWARTLDSTKTADRTTIGGTDTGASQNSNGLIIADNVFRDITGYNEPIFVQGESSGRYYGVTITGNAIYGAGNGQNGIRTEYTERNVIANNTIDEVEGTGISQENIGDGMVIGNRINAADGSGISCINGLDMQISNNMIWNTGVNGVHVQAGADIKVTGNTAKGCGSGGAGYGYRITSACARLTLTGNTYRKWTSATTHALFAISITSTCTGVRRFGNDVIGQGTTGDIGDDTTAPNLSPYDAGTP